MKMIVAALGLILVSGCGWFGTSQSEECERYVACRHAATPNDEGLAQLEAEYGEDGYCWDNVLSETCTDFCIGMLKMAKDQYPNVPACQ